MQGSWRRTAVKAGLPDGRFQSMFAARHDPLEIEQIIVELRQSDCGSAGLEEARDWDPECRRRGGYHIPHSKRGGREGGYRSISLLGELVLGG